VSIRVDARRSARRAVATMAMPNAIAATAGMTTRSGTPRHTESVASSPSTTNTTTVPGTREAGASDIGKGWRMIFTPPRILLVI
jgi:hypothetical protein